VFQQFLGVAQQATAGVTRLNKPAAGTVAIQLLVSKMNKLVSFVSFLNEFDAT
jgi:hypothetical protein